MPYYTFILEYKGGTYMLQTLSGSPNTAFVKGAKSMDAVNVTGLKKAGKASLIEQMKSNEITPVTGLTNVWCKTALISGRLAIVSLIQTDQNPAPRD
ncbi:MAG: hypothetical protein HOP17_03140 [Acidobacteria bacterium]|nr:hypothetical protein [Acidobacteriota bacterium]